MTKPRVIIRTDCRKHWLDIFWYEDASGNRYACPPPDRPWTLEIADGKIEQYERERKTGKYSVPEHTGHYGKLIDNRRTA